jgi:hypothetical protein
MKAKLSAKKQQSPAARKKQQKPAVFGQKAPANPMFVRGTAKKQQSPAAQKKQQKLAELQETFAREKAKMGDLDQELKIARQRLAAVDERLRKAQRKPQLGQKAQAKPAPAMRFA